MASIRVFIVDDQDIVRSGLRRLLETEADVEVVGEAPSGDQALQQIPGARPDVVLMDIKMPVMDGIEATRALKASGITASVVMLTVYADAHVSEALNAGAQGYLLKDITGQELVRAVRAAAQGQAPIHVAVPLDELAHLVGGPAPERASLSERQFAILRLVAQGESNGAIARKLFLSERTIKRELTGIFQKLGVDSRSHAVAYAYEHGLI